MIRRPPTSTLFPYTTLFPSEETPYAPSSPYSASKAASDHLVRGCLRSEEHTSELQSHSDLVCRLLLEKKKTKSKHKAGMERDSKTKHSFHCRAAMGAWTLLS